MSNGLPLNAASDDNPEGGSSCDPIEDQSKRSDSKQKHCPRSRGRAAGTATRESYPSLDS